VIKKEKKVSREDRKREGEGGKESLVCSPSFRVLYGPSPVKYVAAADVCRGRTQRPAHVKYIS